MDIVIIPPDNRVAVDGVWKTVQIDVSHINAARLDGDQGTIEHVEFAGHWPPPRKVDKAEFIAEFADVLRAYEHAKTDAELAAEERARIKAAQEAAAAEANEAFFASLTAEGFLSLVDAAAQGARAKLITPGMEMTYQEKKDQALAVLEMPEDSNPDPAQFPILAASLGIEGDSLHQIAALVMDRYEEFTEKAGEIERVRLAAKRAIREASDAAQARAIYEAVQWP